MTSDAGDFPAALAIWQDALLRWPGSERDVAAAFAFRAAGIASAKHDQWADAADLFDGAAKLVDGEEQPTFALGLPLERWRMDAVAHANAARVVGLIDHIEKLFITGETEAWATVLNSASQDWSIHVASTLAATLLERLTPEALLVCHSLWAHYFVQPHLRGPIAASVECMVMRRWRSLMAVPAMFVSPRTSLPCLLAAMDDPGNGWSKIRMMLQAALAAAPLPAGDQSRLTIEAMAD